MNSENNSRGMVGPERNLELQGMLTAIAQNPPAMGASERQFVERLTLDPPRRSLTLAEADWIERMYAQIKVQGG